MTEVLIVGAGPTGLVLACELLRRGVSVRLIDQAKGPSSQSRALGIHARTLELLEKMGIVDSFLERGIHAEGAFFHKGETTAKLSISPLNSPYPFILLLPQSETESILHTHLKSLGGEIEWNTTFKGFEGKASLIEKEGKVHPFSSAWIVACDGAHSQVRTSLNLSFKGETLPETFFLADVEAECALSSGGPHICFSKKGLGVIIPHPGGEVFRLIFPVTTSSPSLDALLQERALSSRLQVKKTLWESPFHIHRRIVKQMQQNHVFLVGDAAHIHSPVGGQGMNTSIQDAFNLGWKLALVIQGKAQEGLLDSYQAERHPIGEKVLRGTTRATKLLTFFEKHGLAWLFMGLKGVLGLPSFRAHLARAMSGIAFHYRKSPLSFRPSRDRFWKGPKAGDRAPDVKLQDGKSLFSYLHSPDFILLLFKENPALLQRLKETFGESISPLVINDSNLRKTYAAGADSGYLIRPDGYICYRSLSLKEKELMEYLSTLFSHRKV